MKFFLDTANIEEIKKYASWGIIDGVTTNPSLIAKEGASLEKRIKEIAEIINGPISAEVNGEDAKTMVEEAKIYSKWSNNIYIKIPMCREGLIATKELSEEGIKTNVTLIFCVTQAILASKAGATLVSPFVGRLDDISEDGMSLINDIITIFTNYEYKTEVVVASIRHPRHVVDSALIGAHICTIPPDVFDKLVNHPLTDLGIQKFKEDYHNSSLN